MTEEESWGLLTKEQFDDLVIKFTKRFGKPIQSRRLSFSFWDHNRNNVDTRIKITDGNAEIMQKMGSWEMNCKWSRSEQKVNLPSNAGEIFNAYQIIRVLITGEDSCYIAQFDNYIFKQPNFEIKLTHQLGKTDKYNFEVEADIEKVDLSQVLKDLELSEMVTLTNSEFWDKWNKELNLKDNSMDEKQILDLIVKYLTPVPVNLDRC